MAFALAIVSVLSTVANLRLDKLIGGSTTASKKPHFRRCGFVTVISLLSAGVLSWFFDGPMIWAICSGNDLPIP